MSDDLAELVEQVPTLTVPAHTVPQPRWWDDDQCGYCPDTDGASPRQAAAYIAYRTCHDTQHTYRDTVCPGCLSQALVGKRIYAHVWVEIPVPTCLCAPTHGQSCPTCTGDAVDTALTGATA